MYSEKLLRSKPSVVKIFTGLPASMFWQLVSQLEEKEAEYNRQRFQRTDRERAASVDRGARHRGTRAGAGRATSARARGLRARRGRAQHGARATGR